MKRRVVAVDPDQERRLSRAEDFVFFSVIIFPAAALLYLIAFFLTL